MTLKLAWDADNAVFAEALPEDKSMELPDDWTKYTTPLVESKYCI